MNAAGVCYVVVGSATQQQQQKCGGREQQLWLMTGRILRRREYNVTAPYLERARLISCSVQHSNHEYQQQQQTAG
jgi:hypothetical protein